MRRSLELACAGLLICVLVTVFQNCGGFHGFSLQSSSVVGAGGPAPLPTPTPASPFYKSPITMEQLQAQRTADWTHSFAGWEVDYECIDTPADHVPQYAVWDNPIDDDWSEPRVVASSFSFNSPSPGFLTIDRVSNPLDWQKNGGIWRRDEYLTSAQGLTVDFRFKTFPNSSPDAVELSVILDTGSIAVIFSPGMVKLGSVDSTQIRSYTALDTTVFHSYRVTWFPSGNVEVYLDGSIYPIVSGAIYTDMSASTMMLQMPSVTFGDNIHSMFRFTTAVDGGGHFTLNSIKYRRGSLQSLSAITPIMTRTPPPLPPPARFPESFAGASSGLFSSISIPSNFTAMSARSWKVVSGQPIEHNSVAGNETAAVIADPVPGLTNSNGYTVEMRIKMFADTMERGFGLSVLDEMGTTTLVLSKDKVETQVGFKPAGNQTVPIDLTSEFHVIRLVRPAHSMYAYVYIDNDPVPALADIHLSMEIQAHDATAPQPYMQFGNLWYINRTLAANVRAHALVDYIRWHDGANAPPL